MALKSITLTGEQKKALFLPATNPIQIKGVAGSGKTTIAMYRAKHLFDTYSDLFREAEIMIFTYNNSLTQYIQSLLPYVNGGYQENTDTRKFSNKGPRVKVSTFPLMSHDLEDDNLTAMDIDSITNHGDKPVLIYYGDTNDANKAR